jgi:spermidine synthase
VAFWGKFGYHYNVSFLANVKLPKVIFETTSDYNGVIQVIEIGQTLKLSVNNVVQSVNPHSPVVQRMIWGKTAALLKEIAPSLRNILILGLGGGTVQHLIAKQFPELYITTVEIDPVMVDVAKKFFHVSEIPNHRIIVADACRVIASPEDFGISFHYFDAVMVDIFCGDKYPDLGRSGTFLDGLTKIVLPGGFVIFNRIYTHAHQEDVNIFIENVEGFLTNVKSRIIAGKTNSDNALIFGNTQG